ncbi:MAG: siroheme synthase CysG [Neisseria sp.]|nr:siroheme synthase CysG [Neisseria sp.]
MKSYPIFADLDGRAVLLVGGGEVAARKAEMLLKAGAKLRVAAAELSPPFQTWLDEGRAVYLGAAFKEAQLAGVFLVTAATDDAALNRRVFAAAEAAGKFCNSVDDAQHCSFTVPAVIDRSPLQVAVSSHGTAPVLAKKWRQAIETLLPQHLGRAAETAGKWRGRVKEKIAGIRERRRFWENLFDSRFDTLTAAGSHQAAEAFLAAELEKAAAVPLPSEKCGEVVLVGAGPGDAGLLTLNAVQAMQQADVVLYDALVSDEILNLVRRDAEKISVGKRACAGQVPQETTNRLLVEYAQKGRRVVRLKGGDPFVFGRGGEECQVLAAAGIPFRVVPGITAGLGATAYAGIPLTHRDHAQTALFITGHCRPDGDGLRWQTLARGNQTLVMYMSSIRAEDIRRELIAHGRAADTPVAVISNGTRADQSVRTGTLDELPILAANAPRPSITVIGEVVKLRNEISWFGASAAPSAG